jgi:PIN domain nuclease of toxin-antitoxin system
MRLLLDTHTLLWWVEDDTRLSSKARKAIGAASAECHVSLASAWEMAIKSHLGKLKLATPIRQYFPTQLATNGFMQLDIAFRHVARVESLEFHHRDPFDRLLAAQALEEKLTLVSADAVFEDYGVKRLW